MHGPKFFSEHGVMSIAFPASAEEAERVYLEVAAVMNSVKGNEKIIGR